MPQVETCATCMWASRPAGGYCLRPDAGYARARKLTDPFLPAVHPDDHCGSHGTLHMLKAFARGRAAADARWGRIKKDRYETEPVDIDDPDGLAAFVRKRIQLARPIGGDGAQ